MPALIKSHILNRSLGDLRSDLKKAGDSSYAEAAARYFKTGKGEYGEGDIFIGIRVPVLRSIVKEYTDLSFDDIAPLLNSPIHEERMSVGFILVAKYKSKKATDADRKKIFDFYMSNAERFNNWDLVDLSAPNIPGEYLFDKDKKILLNFAKSDNLWKRRISIIATQGFIRRGSYDVTFLVAEILMTDPHDLIHKAVGWMLREVGKKDPHREEAFLGTWYKKMPRTMLRYAIEKFPEAKRKKYLAGTI